MGLCKCPKKKVTNLFCFEHKVNVCEYCLVSDHEKCIVKSYLQWLEDSDYNPICNICNKNLKLDDIECIRLICYDIFHLKCLNEIASNLPETTAPAGYECPSCKSSIIPSSNQAGPLVENINNKLKRAPWYLRSLRIKSPLEENDVENFEFIEKNHSVQLNKSIENQISNDKSMTFHLNKVNNEQQLSSGSRPSKTLLTNNQEDDQKSHLVYQMTSVNEEQKINAVAERPNKSMLTNNYEEDLKTHSIYQMPDTDQSPNIRKCITANKTNELPQSTVYKTPKCSDDDKYSRKSLLTHISTLIKAYFPLSTTRRSPQKAYRYFIFTLVTGIILFIILLWLFSVLGRYSADQDPMLDPRYNPNLEFVKERQLIRPVKDEKDGMIVRGAINNIEAPNHGLKFNLAQLISPPTLFTYPEWVTSNQLRFRHAELERQSAEHLINEADRFEDETDRRTKKTLDDVNKKTEQRINDVNYWKDENEKKTDELFKETDMLNTSTARLDKARAAVKDWLHLTEACRKNRTDKYGIDHCADNVHFNLNKEISTYDNVLKLLDKCEEQAREQLRRNRKANYRLNQNTLNKKAALAIDNYCLEAKPHSADISESQINNDKMKPITSVGDWIDETNEIILNGERERMNSENMRSIIDGILQQIYNDMSKDVDATNLSFKKRIAENKDVKGKDEEHLNRVLQEIKNCETSLEDLKKCLDEKTNFLNLACHRNNHRNHRPLPENCRDDPFIRLHDEIREIKSDMERLRQMIVEHEFQLKALRRRQLSLEEDIQSKAHSIYVDEVICMGIRNTLVVQSY